MLTIANYFGYSKGMFINTLVGAWQLKIFVVKLF